MIVYKFGGASLNSASSINELAGIISEIADDLVIVVSAFGKTTNTLEKILGLWYEGSNERFTALEELKMYHYKIMKDLRFSASGSLLFAEIEKMAGNITAKLKAMPSPDYDFEYDQLVSTGELFSSKIVSSFLNSQNIKNIWLDARKWMITDNSFREGNVDFTESRTQLRHLIAPAGGRRIWLTQGFIGGTGDGFTTTLGREGSDYSAAVIASIIDAEILVVWKDVPGIMTADPLFFPEAEKLDEISYQEAIELSFYGAKVIHPKTIKPLQNKDIPLYVKSFANPREPGTVIHNTGYPVKIKPVLIVKTGQILLSLTPGDFSFVTEDYLSRIFTLFFKYRLKVNLIQHSAISFTICLDNKGLPVRKMVDELKTDFRVLYNENLELITIRHYTPEIISRYIKGRQVLVEQRSRSTAMFIVR